MLFQTRIYAIANPSFKVIEFIILMPILYV
jgi:hypothetical protein